MSDPHFFPLSSSLVQLVHVESIEIAQHYTVSTGIDSPHCEVSAFLIMSVIEPLQSVSLNIIETHFLIISSCTDLLSIDQSIRNAMMDFHFVESLVVHIIMVDTSIQMSTDHFISFSIASQTHHIACIGGIQLLALVIPMHSHFHFPLRKSKDQV